jgi:carbamoylphosphate synthase large subunit
VRVWFNKTFSSAQNALRLIRQGDEDQTYTLVASSPNPHALVRLAADEFHEEPSGLVGDAYVEWCAEFCRRHEIGLFVPGKEAARLADMAEHFSRQGTRILSSAPRAMLDLLHDKGRFYAAVDCPPPPAWRMCTSLAEFDAAHEQLRESHSQLCIKPAVSVYGIGFRRIREDIDAHEIYAAGHAYQIDLPSMRALLAQRDRFPPLLLMEFLPGHEFSVDCVADQGILRCAVARRKPLHAGEGQVIDPREDVQIACAAIVRRFSLNGYANIQFREGVHGLRTLEVNPRMSGGIGMACLAGPNLPYLGVAGFDRGYAALRIPVATPGLRVGEVTQAVKLI